ncbi:MAG: hypothetical protein JRI32_05495 [Deltaproteobacteria bacterium]|nr:hypothetical protein [Deltaproteobacteria bacterium]
MKKAASGAMVFLIMMVAAVSAEAHSTKGRIRVSLDKEVIGIDDIAYFAESYVHRQLYQSKFEKSKRRFYVKEFDRVAQKDGRVDIYFTVLDMKKNTTFDDTMTLSRKKSGVWSYTPEGGGPPVEVYTYVNKFGYYHEKYLFPASACGLAAALCAFGVIRIRKKRGEKK